MNTVKRLNPVKSLNPIKNKLNGLLNIFKNKNKDIDDNDTSSVITDNNTSIDNLSYDDNNDNNIENYYNQISSEYTNIIIFFIKLLNDPGFISIINKYSNNINAIDFLKYDTINVKDILDKNKNLLVDLIKWFIFDYNHNWFMVDLLSILQSFLEKPINNMNADQKYEFMYDILLDKLKQLKQKIEELKNVSNDNELNEYNSRYILIFIVSFAYIVFIKDDVSKILKEKNDLINTYQLSLKCLVNNFLNFFEQNKDISKKNDKDIDSKEIDKKIKIKQAIHFLIEYAFGIYNEKSFLIFIDNMAGLSELYQNNVAECEVFVIVAFTQFIIQAITLENISSLLKYNITNLTGFFLAKFKYSKEKFDIIQQKIQQSLKESLNRINENDVRDKNYMGDRPDNSLLGKITNIAKNVGMRNGGKNITQKKKKILHRSRKIRR